LNDDYNGATQDGLAWMQMMSRRGHRDDGLSASGLAWRNLTVELRAQSRVSRWKARVHLEDGAVSDLRLLKRNSGHVSFSFTACAARSQNDRLWNGRD
jgi:hypothetical protein